MAIAITAAAWQGLRRLVGASPAGAPGRGRSRILLLDALPPFAGLALFTLPTARPIMASLGVLALTVGMGVTDRIKRVVLREPVVFADRSEMLEMVRHPRLYLAFVGVGRVAAGVAAAVAVVAFLIWIEPPWWRLSLWGVLWRGALAAAIGRALFVAPTAPSILRRLAAFYAGLAPSRDPIADAARFGLLATCAIQATLARAERPGRQHAAQARAWPPLDPDCGPIVIVQGESFVDAARLHPDLAATLPHFARLRRESLLQGKLDVPCWGANTIRTELAVLAGLGPGEVGLDRYNPYERFVRVPLPSLASVARTAGYRTICLHPYDAAFYARDRVMPLLGFDEFVGIEGFADAPKVGPYVGDVALAGRAADIIARHGPRVLVFVITMENHGPWDAAHESVIPAPLPIAWEALPDALPTGRWLRHLASTDAMIPILCDAIGAKGRLLFYGDHQPSLAGAFTAPGADDRRTDYALWAPGGGAGERRDLSAEQLADTLLRSAGSG